MYNLDFTDNRRPYSFKDNKIKTKKDDKTKNQKENKLQKSNKEVSKILKDTLSVEKTTAQSSEKSISHLSKSEGSERIQEAAEVTQIQALIRGWKTRNEVFLTHQVLPFVNRHLLGYPEEIKEDTARVICLELNKMSMDPEKYKGKSLKLGAKLKAHAFSKPGESPTKITRPFDLWLEMDNKGKAIKILIIPQEPHSLLGKQLASGGYKDVYRAQEFEFPRTLEGGEREISQSPSVLAKLKDKNTVQRGLKIQKELLETTDGKIAELAVTRAPNPAGFIEDAEMKQKWYNGDMQQAIKSGSIPLDFTLNPKTIPITMQSILDVFIDVAITLEKIHEKEVVHRDVKPQNILIKVNDSGQAEGFLSDFDLAQKMGKSNISSAYPYWDVLSQQGLVYPTSDDFGLLISLGESLIPHFSHLEFLKTPSQLLNPDTLNHSNYSACTTHAFLRLKAIDDASLDPLKKIFLEFYNGSTQYSEMAIIYSPEELSLKFEEFISSDETLSPEIKTVIENIGKEIKVITRTLHLIAHAAEKNERVKSMMETNITYASNFSKNTDSNPNKIYKQILRPLFSSTKELRKELESLKKML